MVANFSRSRDSLLSSTTSRISEYARYSAIINTGVARVPDRVEWRSARRVRNAGGFPITGG